MTRLLTLAAAVSTASAAYQGFNYGANAPDGSAMTVDAFQQAFEAAAQLAGTNGGFTSARLFTMIQAGTTNTLTDAIAAALKTKTTLLLGLWASAGQDVFNNELAALKAATAQYCNSGLNDLVVGISVGSEDLYRITPTSQARSSDPGAQPGTIVKYINDLRNATKGTCLEKQPVGHVDTWTAWVIGSNAEVIQAVDWLGMDAYPYFENTSPNDISSGVALFNSALQKTTDVAGSKPVWITETGWPVSGATENLAVPNNANAETYWQEVGCPRFGNTNIWWYTYQDAATFVPNPSFGVVRAGNDPLFDLTCKAQRSSSSTQAQSQTSTSQNPPPSSTSDASGPTNSSTVSTTESSTSSSSSPENSTSVTQQSSQQTVASSSTSVSPSTGGGSPGSSSTGSPSPSAPPPTSGAAFLNALAGVAAGVVLAFAAL